MTFAVHDGAGPSRDASTPMTAETMDVADRKKRTRPVSACESCRSKKVKCNLLPDRPVCINCEQSGKQCLFRVDDLSPALRRERFSEYGEPARADMPPHLYRRRKSRRKSSVLSIAREDFAPGTDGHGGSTDTDQADADDSTESGSAAKTKAVFRCFANPTKLAAPSAPSAALASMMDASSASESSLGMSQDAAQKWTYPWGAPHQVQNGSGDARQSRRNTVDSYWAPQGSNISYLQEGQNLLGQTQQAGVDTSIQSSNPARPQQHRSYSDAAVLGSAAMPPPSVPNSLSRSLYDTARDEVAPQFWPGHQHLARSELPSPSLRSEDQDMGGNAISSYTAPSNTFSPHEHGSARDSIASAASRPPATFRKIALPFFRWFGATANTPGIRRIKVGVYHDAEGEVGRGEAESLISAETQSPNVLEQPTTSQSQTPSRSLLIDQLSSGQAPEPTVSSSSRELFEADRPRYPRRDILNHLTGLFLKCFKASYFPWLDSAEVIASADNGEMPAIMANAICALTARFSNRTELRSAKHATEAFSDMAKILIVPMLSWPSIDVIEALIMLSYVEFAAGADAGLWMYIGMALRMATDLGLQHELTIQSMATARHKDRARYIFWSIVGLDRITCFGTGRPVTMRDDAYDCQLPPLSDDVHSDAYVFNHIIRLLLHRGQIGELLNRRQEGRTRKDCSLRLQELWRDLATFHEMLPSPLRFGVTAFRKMAALDNGPAFVYLHVLLQSTISLINRPSLLRRFDRDNRARAPTELAKVANHASATIASILRFAADAGQHGMQVPAELAAVNVFVDCNPFLDQLILPAGRALLAEREVAADGLRQSATQGVPPADDAAFPIQHTSGRGTNVARHDELVARRQYADLHLASCQQMLDRIAKWWLGAAWPARALQQETLGAGISDEDNGPDGKDEEAQPAPIRDVEMVLKWAKARRLRAHAELATPDCRAAESSQAIRTPKQHDGSQLLGSEEADLRIARLLEEAQKQQASSSLGLGVSGSMGAESAFDIDSMITAWTRELEGIDSSAAWVPDMMASPSRANLAGPSSSTTMAALPSTVTPTLSATIASQWPEAPNLPLTQFNLNGMQLEELLFDPYNGHGLAYEQHRHADATGLDAMSRQTELMPDAHGAHRQAQNQESQQERLVLDVNRSEQQLSTLVSEQDLRTLPSALFNAFSFPPTPSVFGESR